MTKQNNSKNPKLLELAKRQAKEFLANLKANIENKKSEENQATVNKKEKNKKSY